MTKYYLILIFIPLLSTSSVYYQFLKFASVLKDKNLSYPDNILESCYKKNCLSLCDRFCEREALGCASRSKNFQSRAIACFRAADRIVPNQKEVEDCLYACDIKTNGIDVEIRKPLLTIRGGKNYFAENNSVEECWINKCSDFYTQCDDDDECRGGMECSWQNGMTRYQRSVCITKNSSPMINQLIDCIRECDLDDSLIFTDQKNADI